MQRLPEIGEMIERLRPEPTRIFDQIPMKTDDLIAQARRMKGRLAGTNVVFVGDYDCFSVALVAVAKSSSELPNSVLVVDFDRRVLKAVEDGFRYLGLSQLLETSCYNVFDGIPDKYAGIYDHFYANPPYGQFNQGESVWLFTHRGIEFCGEGGTGSLIIPCDGRRTWTTANVYRLQRQVMQAGWSMEVQDSVPHSYVLDDDPELQSMTFHLEHAAGKTINLPWRGKSVPHDFMPCFYGRCVSPPFPLQIDVTGSAVFAMASVTEEMAS